MMNYTRNYRRKRKDPESREYFCKCGKAYLSYAAAYTHVKNKHQLAKEFHDGIVKPQRDKLRRGRPSEKTRVNINADMYSLSIVEEAILKIYNILTGVAGFSTIILEGNDYADQRTIYLHESYLINQFKEQGYIDVAWQPTPIQNYFIQMMIKHFKAYMAARTTIAIQLIMQIYDKYNNEEPSLTRAKVYCSLSTYKLWYGHYNVNGVLIEAYTRWHNLLYDN